jgi:salicylate hydroxylase
MSTPPPNPTVPPSHSHSNQPQTIHHPTPATKQKPHLAIIGAGITGTTLAIALARRGISHTLYEQAPHATELGAGLGFGPNAERAIKVIDQRLGEVFLGMGDGGSSSGSRGGYEDRGGGGGNGDEDEPVWIEFLDGTSGADAREVVPVFRVLSRFGDRHPAVHRAKWLETLMGMVPEGVVQFGKRLEAIDQSGDMVVLRFEDGTTAEADAVVGCDGVKSKVREILVGGREKEGARCGYSGKYAYRCMISMEEAVQEIGRQRAGVSSLWVSPAQCRHRPHCGVSQRSTREDNASPLTQADGPRQTCSHLSRRKPRTESIP